MYFLSKVTIQSNNRAKQAYADFYRQHQQYAVHQALWQLFDLPEHSERPFLYREFERFGQTFYYMLSNIPPLNQHSFFSIQTKPFAPNLSVGQRLGFELRANPSTSQRDDTGKTFRQDVLMVARHKALQQGFDDAYTIDDKMQQAGIDWLTKPKRNERWGIHFEDVQLGAYQQHRFFKPNSRGQRPIQFASLDYQGILQIDDVDKFWQQMIRGFGKQKAFGCGLILIRPV